ncbi:MAG: hypothetical protein EXS51_01800 [Candidatus Taylorbacteria bacterium]|nr:hypothetical protein [Candidatus Taylorbacteria bacterium]
MTPTSRGNRGFIKMILLIAIVFLAGGAYIIFAKDERAPQKPSSTSAQEEPVTAASETSKLGTPSTQVGWETFQTDAIFIQYPAEWMVQDNGKKSSGDYHITFWSNAPGTPPNSGLNLGMTTGDSATLIKTTRSSYERAGGKVEQSTVLMGGKPATRLKITLNATTETHIITQNGGSTYHLSGSFAANDASALARFEYFYQSFRFIK